MITILKKYNLIGFSQKKHVDFLLHSESKSNEIMLKYRIKNAPFTYKVLSTKESVRKKVLWTLLWEKKIFMHEQLLLLSHQIEKGKKKKLGEEIEQNNLKYMSGYNLKWKENLSFYPVPWRTNNQHLEVLYKKKWNN